jgi:hypothetical protein
LWRNRRRGSVLLFRRGLPLCPTRLLSCRHLGPGRCAEGPLLAPIPPMVATAFLSRPPVRSLPLAVSPPDTPLWSRPRRAPPVRSAPASAAIAVVSRLTWSSASDSCSRNTESTSVAIHVSLQCVTPARRSIRASASGFTVKSREARLDKSRNLARWTFLDGAAAREHCRLELLQITAPLRQ